MSNKSKLKKSVRQGRRKKPHWQEAKEHKEKSLRELEEIVDHRADELRRIQKEMRGMIRFAFLIGMGAGAALVGTTWYILRLL